MASSAIDDAIQYLDSIISRLKLPASTQSTLLPEASAPTPTKVTASDRKAINGCGRTEEAAANMSLEETKKDYLKHEKASETIENAPANVSLKDSVPSNAENFELFNKAHIQVGLIEAIEDHPVAEKLYVCKVEVANKELRQVVAGLKKFIPKSELLGRKVCTILNLKPAKLAGQVSEAMILAGDSTGPDVQVVKVLEPPSNSAVGDRIYLQGGTPSANPAKQLSSKIWEKIVPLLKVEGGFATFDKTLLVSSAGAVKVEGLPDGSGIH